MGAVGRARPWLPRRRGPWREESYCLCDLTRPFARGHKQHCLLLGGVCTCPCPWRPLGAALASPLGSLQGGHRTVQLDAGSWGTAGLSWDMAGLPCVSWAAGAMGSSAADVTQEAPKPEDSTDTWGSFEAPRTRVLSPQLEA